MPRRGLSSCPAPAPAHRPGRGAVYSYDAIGSYERTGYSCQGSGKDLIQPVLDNQLKAASPLLVPPRVRRAAVCPIARAFRRCRQASLEA